MRAAIYQQVIKLVELQMQDWVLERSREERIRDASRAAMEASLARVAELTDMIDEAGKEFARLKTFVARQ